MSRMFTQMVSIQMKIDFKNKRVLVTGGTRGIGRQIAEDMLDLGATLTVTGKKSHCIFPGVEYMQVDFLDNESTNKFIEVISNQTYDICINNAGINKIDSFCDVKREDWDHILKVNLTAPFLIQQAVVDNMVKQGYGKIINIASIWGSISVAKRAAYSSSKFGLRGLTLASAAELSRFNVLVNTVSPGFTLTDLTRQVLGPERMQEISQNIPMGRMAEPAEISKVVLFMASELNSYISGQNIIVDGGFVNV
jgi:NAD(P)-dependent dehydrogenase (short-subunit alcohol dehydrogenase family)